MGGSWRPILALALTSLTGRSIAFVVRGPLALGNRAHRTTVSATRSSLPDARISQPGSTWAAADAAYPSRTPSTCLAPGGKVGRQKVSLDRAVTSIAAPKPEQKQEQETKKVTKTKRATQTEDAPMFNVIVIGDEEYNREHVVMSIQDIVPDTDNTRAAEIFEEAQEVGKGMCGTYPEEEAELYVEQFTRCEPTIYADMEKEGAAMRGAQTGAPA